MQGFYMTDCGKLREINEDSGSVLRNKHNQLLAIIADGMGGHQAGEVASELAVKLANESWQQSSNFTKEVEAERWIQKLFTKMNEHILKKSIQNEKYQGMGTTVVLAVCTETFLTIGHIGDSRCYISTGENKFEQLTSDHTLVNELIRSGELAEIDAEHHPRKNVLLKAVGTEETILPDIRSLQWNKNDKILLCSDGLSNKIEHDELSHALATMENLQQTAEELVHLANERGGEDNISLAIVHHNRENDVGEAT